MTSKVSPEKANGFVTTKEHFRRIKEASVKRSHSFDGSGVGRRVTIPPSWTSFEDFVSGSSSGAASRRLFSSNNYLAPSSSSSSSFVFGGFDPSGSKKNKNIPRQTIIPKQQPSIVSGAHHLSPPSSFFHQPIRTSDRPKHYLNPTIRHNEAGSHWKSVDVDFSRTRNDGDLGVRHTTSITAHRFPQQSNIEYGPALARHKRCGDTNTDDESNRRGNSSRSNNIARNKKVECDRGGDDQVEDSASESSEEDDNIGGNHQDLVRPSVASTRRLDPLLSGCTRRSTSQHNFPTPMSRAILLTTYLSFIPPRQTSMVPTFSGRSFGHGYQPQCSTHLRPVDPCVGRRAKEEASPQLFHEFHGKKPARAPRGVQAAEL